MTARVSAGVASEGAVPERYLVAIDTASEQAGLAIFDGQRISELAWPAGRSQTVSLLSALQQLLDLTGATVEMLGAVAVTIGPGSFSGLRVGLGAAKGLALGLGCPIIGVPTLDAALFPLRHLPFAGLGIVPAGRSRVVWSLALGDQPATAPINSTVPEMIAAITVPGPIIVAGEIDAAQAALLTADARFRVPVASLGYRRPAAVAALGWSRWQTGAVDDLASLAPAYAGREEPAARA